MKFYSVIPYRELILIGSSAGTAHMVEARHVVKNEPYLGYLTFMARRGDSFIVDNGAADPGETPVDFQDVLHIANELDADYVVLPDRRFDAHWTLLHTLQEANHVPPYKRMIVPQGETLDEWMDCLQAMAYGLQGEYALIGIAKIYEHAFEANGGRSAIAREIRKQIQFRAHGLHYLGFHRDFHKELEAIKPEFGVVSFDSGLPIAHAQHEVMTSEVVETKSLSWVQSDKYFSVSKAIHNLQYVRARGRGELYG